MVPQNPLVEIFNPTFLAFPQVIFSGTRVPKAAFFLGLHIFSSMLPIFVTYNIFITYHK